MLKNPVTLMLRYQITLSKCFFSILKKIRKWLIAKRSYLRDNLYDHLWSKAFYEAITTWTSLSGFSLLSVLLRQWQDNGLCYYKLAVCSSRTVQRSSLQRREKSVQTTFEFYDLLQIKKSSWEHPAELSDVYVQQSFHTIWRWENTCFFFTKENFALYYLQKLMS